MSLQAYKPTSLQAYKPTSLQAYKPTSLQAYKPTSLVYWLKTTLQIHYERLLMSKQKSKTNQSQSITQHSFRFFDAYKSFIDLKDCCLFLRTNDINTIGMFAVNVLAFPHKKTPH
ncbi:hypothetical protein HNR69_001556 [Histophilus somni]|uniref:hypothetical protein n=1 Tax=Histophilus somni TaxID=731 RepID=UPI001607B09E|nr:hypothetical protein [Histophilus somni]MBB5152098.1 hypothetical protein [Histophilus somni]